VRRALVTLLVPAALATAPSALPASGGSWASAEIQAVTQSGIFPSSAADFRPQAPLSQQALAAAIAATNTIQHPPTTQPAPTAPEVVSTIADGSTIGGVAPWEVDAPGRVVARADFAVDGVGIAVVTEPPFAFDAATGGIDTGTLADGPHRFTVKVSFTGGGYALSTVTADVANASTDGTPASAPVQEPLPVAKWSLPAAPDPEAGETHALYRATVPGAAVTVKQLDAALVGYLDLGAAARAIQKALVAAGLQPPANTGTETIARLLGLRLNHPARDDALELLPDQPATRAEAAWSFAHLLRLTQDQVSSVAQAAAAFTLPQLTPWQRRILTTAVSYVGYPYVWGGTSPTHQVEFGVPSVGGFDCSGFVWRVYKLTPYEGEGDLAGVLRGRTTYQMSGEVPRRDRITMKQLHPADVLFFGEGPGSRPSVVDHAGIYLGDGWFVQSSDEGVTLLPLDGWYTQSFAWARRPLHEAGLE